MKKNRFGLIGYPLTHSFSKKFFTEKFKEWNLEDTHQYDLFEIKNIEELKAIVENTEGLVGLNVTIPHKLNVLPYLSEIDPAAEKIGAVNVLKVLPNNKLKGYNSDYYGFKKSLEEFVKEEIQNLKALILGNGGATKAILTALEDLSIEYKIVSRNADQINTVSYETANSLISEYRLIINCSPVGTYPKVNESPLIDYNLLTPNHFLYDLVYNPETTMFMHLGKQKGAQTLNGYKMLVYQAEKSWEIWNL